MRDNPTGTQAGAAPPHYSPISSFITHHRRVNFGKDNNTGNYAMTVGAYQLQLGAPADAEIVAVQDTPSNPVTVLQSSTPDCPVDYVAVDVSSPPFHNWHMGDCHTPLNFSTDGQQMFAQPADRSDGRVWIYSQGQMYGPIDRATAFAGSEGAPGSAPSQPSSGQLSTQTASNAPGDQGNSTAATDSTPPAPKPAHHKKPRTTSTTDQSQADSLAPKAIPRTVRFDPNCLNSAPTIDANNTPYNTVGSFTPGTAG
ncbi:MAG: hypothetical protein ABSD74_00140 [Rhizomicrobium sp.]